MVRYGIFQPEPAEPAVSQIQMHLFAQSSLGANTEAVPDDQHTDHQFGINGGPTCMAIEFGQVLA
jgi:hypothetical protein